MKFEKENAARCNRFWRLCGVALQDGGKEMAS